MAGIAAARQLPATARWPVRIGALGHRHVLVGILIGAAAIRITWTAVAAPPPESDFLTFLEMARTIGRGAWWPGSYGWLYQGPGYPLLLAPLTLLGEATLPAIHAANIALGVLTVGLVYRLGSVVFDPRTGLVAAAITAAFPGLWTWTPIVGAENLSVPLLVGIAVLLAERRRAWTWPLLGALTGYLAYVRPSMLLFVVVVAVSLVWLTPMGRKGRALSGLGLGFALSMGVLGTANVLAGGPALPLGNGGWEPWLVHNERATGAWMAIKDRDDYPFQGMEGDPSFTDDIRAGQIKLATEFVALNPGEFLPGLAERHAIEWRSDAAALDWTIRGPSAGPVSARMEPYLDVIVDGYYLLVLGCALLGVWLLGARPVVTLVLVVPLAYLIAPLVIAEGNPRFHVNGLAYLAVLAAGALTSRSWHFGLAAVAAALAIWLAPPGLVPGPWLVAAIVGVGLAALGLDAWRNLRRWSSADPGRHRVRLALIGVLVASELALAGALLVARQVVVDWSLTRPDGWTMYRSGTTAEQDAGAVTLIPSDVASRLTKVSYPDAAVLPIPASSTPGERVGLARTFPDLQVGARLVVYLQVLVPASTGDAERVAVLLNDRVVWEAPLDPVRSSRWHDVVVPWLADTPFATVRVERPITATEAPDVLVRSIHVYPKY